MGVPTLFIRIFRNKFYKNVHAALKIGGVDCDYFFIDFNGIIYTCFEKIKKNIIDKNVSKNKIEELLIEEVLKYTKYLICTVLKPQKLTYISFDGPAPRAKMVQQRSRRYKTYFDKVYHQNERSKKHINLEPGIDWDTSANISPGTEFMQKISIKIQEAMKAKFFNDHDDKMQVILSDAAVPGEGEHKFLDSIRKMRVSPSLKDAKVYIYGKDADLIILAVSIHKNNMFIFRDVKSETDPELKKMYIDKEFLVLNIDNLRNGFNNEITRNFDGHSFNKTRILNDYIFLTFLVGNDFVLSLPFLKVKKDGLPLLLSIYHELKLKHTDYLVIFNHEEKKEIKPPTVNIVFLTDIMLELSNKEDFVMKNHQKSINRIMKGAKDNRRTEDEAQKSPFEIFQSRYKHLEVCNPDHPLYAKYFPDFEKINYEQDYDIWRKEYYKFYLNIDDNEEEYNEIIKNIVLNYLESLMFTLNYYFIGIPSWTWYYKYRVPPLFSDIYNVLNQGLINMNEITFDLGKPYTPYQQLMTILPPQMSTLLPEVFRPIMNDDSLLCTQFYPIDFKIEATFGIKTIYSEAILPEIDEEILLPVIKKAEKNLSPSEMERNKIRERPLKC